MRAITWRELNGTWYGVLARAGQVIPEGKPNYGQITFSLPKTNSVDLEQQYKIECRLEGIRTSGYARTVEHGINQCEYAFKEWLEERGLLAQVDLDYARVQDVITGYWQDVGTIAENVGGLISYERISAALKLLIADGKVETVTGRDGSSAPVYRATLK